jgi:hypothetical protein
MVADTHINPAHHFWGYPRFLSLFAYCAIHLHVILNWSDFMNLATSIALVLFTMVGYSIGRNLFTNKYKVSLIALELPLILLIWLGAIFIPLTLGKGLKIVLWVTIALIIGFILTRIASSKEDKPKYKSMTSETEIQKPNLWEQWKKFAAKMGDFQGRLMLMWFYFLIITPFGILVRLFSDPLSRKQPKSSGWLDRPIAKSDIEKSRRQF